MPEAQAPAGIVEIVSDDFPVFHHGPDYAFCGPRTANENTSRQIRLMQVKSCEHYALDTLQKSKTRDKPELNWACDEIRHRRTSDPQHEAGVHL